MRQMLAGSTTRVVLASLTLIALAAGAAALGQLLVSLQGDSVQVPSPPEGDQRAGAELGEPANAGVNLTENDRPRAKVPSNGRGHVAAPDLLQRALERLHKEALTRFLMADGNGQRRMIIFPEKVKSEWKIPWWSPGEIAEPTPVRDSSDLAKIHAESVRDYTDPKAAPALHAAPLVIVGEDPILFKDAMRKLKEKDWDIKTLDLIGLVKHEHPVAYVSEKLLEMKKLKDTPTRLLDFFELAGLEELNKGEALFIRSKDETIRMLGALRATGECVRCHQCDEGTLLGAFSYTLRPAQYRNPLANGRGSTDAVPPQAKP
jgi:hypothetical protein